MPIATHDQAFCIPERVKALAYTGSLSWSHLQFPDPSLDSMVDEPNRMIGRHSVCVGERRMRKFAIFTILITVQFVELQQLVVGGRIEERSSGCRCGRSAWTNWFWYSISWHGRCETEEFRDTQLPLPRLNDIWKIT